MAENIILNFKKSLLGRYTKNLFQLMPKKVTSLMFNGIDKFNTGSKFNITGTTITTRRVECGSSIFGSDCRNCFYCFYQFRITTKHSNGFDIIRAVVSFIAILNRLQTLMTAEIQFQFAAHMRKQLYMAITNSNWLFLSTMKSSNFAHALTNEIERISNGTGRFLSLLSSIMILIVYIIFALKTGRDYHRYNIYCWYIYSVGT